MWEQFKSWLLEQLNVHRSAVRTDVKAELAEALKTSAGLAEAQAQLTQAQADLATAKQTIASLESKANTVSAEAKAVNDAISAALSSLKLETKADATSAEKISAIADSVSATLAKLAVDPSKLPNNKAEASKAATTATDEAKLLEQFMAITDPVKRVEFIKSIRK